jgi:phosphatidylinositol transfer protein SFH5
MDTIHWRRDFSIPILNKELLQRELATGKNYVSGKAKDGRPIVYLLLGKENTWDPVGNTTALVYTLERAVRSMATNVQETICIVDCEGVGMMNAPSTAFLGNIIDILGKHYPRRNGQIFICNVSSVFYFVWNVISLSLSEMTKKKIQILTSDVTEMRRVIGKILYRYILYIYRNSSISFVLIFVLISSFRVSFFRPINRCERARYSVWGGCCVHF